jgi:drug/metabolite transporter (DMT)-like permease
MSFLLCTLTTFFGWFNAVKERRAGVVEPAFIEGTKWAGQAWINGFTVGSPALLIAVGLTFGVNQFAPDVSVGFWTAVLGIGFGAGVLGYVLHSMAIERGGAIGQAAA